MFRKGQVAGTPFTSYSFLGENLVCKRGGTPCGPSVFSGLPKLNANIKKERMVRGSFFKTFVWCILPRGAPSCCGLQKPTHFLQTQLIEKQYLLYLFIFFSLPYFNTDLSTYFKHTLQLKTEKTMTIFVAVMCIKLFEAKKLLPQKPTQRQFIKGQEVDKTKHSTPICHNLNRYVHSDMS